MAARSQSSGEKGRDNVGFDIELEDKPDSKGGVQQVQLTSPSSASTLSSQPDDDELRVDSFGGQLWHCVRNDTERRNYWIKKTCLIVIALLYNAYFAATVWYAVHNGIPIDFCDGVGFHIILTGLVYLCLFYFQIVKRYWGKAIYTSVMQPIGEGYDRVWKHRYSYYKISTCIQKQ